MISGLAESGWPATEVAAITDDIGSGVKQAFGAIGGISADEVNSFAANAVAAANTKIASMERDCIANQ